MRKKCVLGIVLYSLMTSIKLTQPLQHNQIKVAQKFNAFLLLICCSIPDFVISANSEETVVKVA